MMDTHVADWGLIEMCGVLAISVVYFGEEGCFEGKCYFRIAIEDGSVGLP
jgi:hypothetical protein